MMHLFKLLIFKKKVQKGFRGIAFGLQKFISLVNVLYNIFWT